MDISKNKHENSTDDSSKCIPVLSEYAKALEGRVKERYLQKISVIGVDPATIPTDQFSPECLPPVEVSDLLSYLVLETSYYTNQQFKAFKSLEAFNQMVSGFVTSVVGKLIAGKYGVRARVQHSQRMNDPLVNIWIITEQDGTVWSAHCLGCKAGLAESCSHIASVLFYLEATTRLHGKLACTQVKCSWILPTYVNEVPYARVKDINFSSAKKLKENLDQKIDNLNNLQQPTISSQPEASHSPRVLYSGAVSTSANSRPSREEIDELYVKLDRCKIKAVALSLISPFADQYVDQSRSVPVVSELFLGYTELLRKCTEVQLNYSEDQIKLVEKNTQAQSKGAGFFKHRAGRIGASIFGAVFHSNLSQPSQSLIKTICYPSLYKINNKAMRHGCKHEGAAITAYETVMKKSHVNFQVKKCGLFINKDYPFLHATPDFLTSCDCCGLGCGEVKCPFGIYDAHFKEYVRLKNSCLVKMDGVFKLKREHNYYHQTQQQLFTLKDRRHNDFIVYAVDQKGNAQLVMERILPDKQHWTKVLPKLEAFWRICVLPEVLGRWYTRRCTVKLKGPGDGSICFCRTLCDGHTVACSNEECPYGRFHTSCLSLGDVTIPNKWYCPHCSRLPQFKRYSRKQSGVNMKAKAKASALIHASLLCDTICICKVKAKLADRLVECHGPNCTNGKFFHMH